MSAFEFTITIQSRDKVRAEAWDHSEEFDDLKLDENLHLATIEIFEDWLRQGKITQRRELEVLGMHLYHVLFSPKIEAFYEKHLDDVPKDERMRVQLRFLGNAIELANLPWEYLYYPDTETRRGYFLSTSVDLVLSRSISHQKLAFPPEKELRLLIVVSSPPPLAINATPIITEIQALTKDCPLQVETLDEPTVGKFQKALEDIKPHIVHFIGDGRFDRSSGKGEIALLGSDAAGALWKEDKEFADYFIQAKCIPRLVFLHLSEEKMADLNASFAGLAPKLLHANIQTVVAMQYPISGPAAIDFTKVFYRELMRGTPVDDAVQAGRARVKLLSSQKTSAVRDFGTPVLYMYSSDPLIQPPDQRPGGAVDQAAVPPPRSSTVPGTRPEATAGELVERVISAGQKTVLATDLGLNQQLELAQKLSGLRLELAGKAPPEMKQTLFDHYVRETPLIQKVIEMMIHALGEV